MAFKGWPEITILTDQNKQETAKAPLIISASRATDIPAFYSEWFFNRLEKGYLKWINPFNGKASNIAFQNTRVIVFWSKNPSPIIPYLPILDEKNISYYFLFTLNDYEKENLEPNLPVLSERIDTFIHLADTIGKEKVLWRFDPLILSNDIGIETLINRIKNIGDQIHPYTEKLIFSFVQISKYKKVQKKLLHETTVFDKENLFTSEFSEMQKLEFADQLKNLADLWKIQAVSCAEKMDLTAYGIDNNKCIDDELMRRLFNQDKKLQTFLDTGNPEPNFQKDLFQANKQENKPLKDKGQRKECGCIPSKDIGQYNTCMHLCAYCYANANKQSTLRNFRLHDPGKETIY